MIATCPMHVTRIYSEMPTISGTPTPNFATFLGPYTNICSEKPLVELDTGAGTVSTLCTRILAYLGQAALQALGTMG